MRSKVIVPPRISRAIRSFALSREILVELLVRIHDATCRDYESFRQDRMTDERFCQYRISIVNDDNVEHLFVLVIDDTTSPDDLFIFNIGHGIV